MERTRIYRLYHLRPTLANRLRDAQIEAARVWTLCRDLHLYARQHGLPWPNRDDLQRATKGGQFALHSQTIQMVCHTFLANVETTRQLKATNPKMRYPYKDKRYYPLSWPAQTVSIERGRIVLPMGRGRPALIFRLDTSGLPERVGGCKLVWKDGYELHVSIPVENEVVETTAQEVGSAAEMETVPVRATVDLGKIHQAAVSTNTGKAIVISGRGIRSLKRRQNMALGQIARKCSRCEPGSKRWRELQHARQQQSARIERQVRDLRHKGTRKVITFCQEQHVSTLYIGNPHGVRKRLTGRHHHQRMSQWEYGKGIAYLTEKAKQARIESFTGSERGTSSQCPVCGRKQKPKGREWVCRNPQCGFHGHRDVVGSVNMHPLAYNQKISFPAHITYQRAGPVRVSQRNEEPPRVRRRASASPL